MSQQLDASAFVQTLGVGAHVSWPNYYPYSNTANVISALNYLGVHNIRDTINSSVTGVLDQLAKAGNHFDFIIDRQDTPSHFLSLIDSFEASHPGATRSLEGPNEVDFWPPSYAGLTGYAAARQMQIDLWNDHLADPLLKNIPVYATTISGTDASKYTQLGNISAYANYGNVHDYYGGGQPGPAWSAWTSAANIDMPGKPVVTTETGSSSAYLSYGVDETVQAKQILNTVADAALHGVSSTYLYELVESQQGDATNAEAHYGLYRYDWTPKPAAVALHNFTTILTTGPGDGSTAAVNYTISGLPSTGASVEFHEASGAHDIVVWAEPDIWNDATHQEITAPTSQVTVNLGATYHSVVVYDPLVSAQAQKTYTDVSQITVGVTDHPLIIEINGSGATTGGATGGTSTTPAPAAPTGLSDAGIVGGYVNAAHNTASQALTGVSAAGATITVYDGAAKLGTATADSTGHWGYTIGGLADGAHALTATATTAGGVSASSAALTFTVDTVAPGAPSGLADSAIVNGVVDAAHDTASQTLTGAAAAGSTVTVYDGAAKLGVVTANSSGQWSYALGQLADGAHSVTATATDQAGNTGPASGALQFTVNTQAASSTPAQPTAPAPTAPHLSDVTATWWKQAALTGEAASGSLVKVYDNGAPIGTATADSSGAWSLATRLGNGVHSFTETATDSAGSTVGSTGVALFSRSTGVQLNGGSGDDVLVGRAGDTLSGHGGHDSFVFNPSFGRETVADFSPASDTIVFDHNLFGSASAVLQHATQSGTSVLIAYDANDVVTLQNTSLSSLTQGNFAFV